MSDSPVAAVAAPVNAAAPAPVDANQELSELDAAEAAEEALANPADPKAPVKAKEKKAIEQRIKKLKLKVDGKEFEQEVNFDDDESLIRELQMAKVGQKRSQEKAELEKELGKFLGQLNKNPLETLAKEMGMNVDQVIEKYINEQIENSKKSPDQLEREKLQAELNQLRQEQENEKQTFKQKELERLQNQEFERYDMLMEQALTKSDIPKSPYVVKKIADYMLVALQNGYDVTPDDVIPLVREEMHSDLGEMFQSMPEDVIEKLLGDRVLNKLRKRRVAKAQDATKALGKSGLTETGKTSKTESDKPKTKTSFKDFFGV